MNMCDDDCQQDIDLNCNYWSTQELLNFEPCNFVTNYFTTQKYKEDRKNEQMSEQLVSNHFECLTLCLSTLTNDLAIVLTAQERNCLYINNANLIQFVVIIFILIQILYLF
ncbi:hypothetical protein PPERSA_08604 [Pseudocohnilembus persalinus]|uniref:Transmembrane protein n=1 Tax=Pseudocohnilembus persalinus TaxID=266149 RepID=A0A0V0R2I9_PSEPJ|nr:hypothetical protein PPERSA_08604 [Pseudocohnilembus persalinus]|eukprot:KRX08405.1 hypothetical protein PPERSA_08604 [Pseudocohnilembus persalinus]